MTTRAFDTALFVAAPNASQDGVVVDVIGPPFTTKFAPLVVGSKSGVVVGASMPAATAKDQILISGAGPNYAWALGTNPAASASVPAPDAEFSVLVADATPSWQNGTAAQIVVLGHGVTTDAGGTFISTANLVFAPTGVLTVRMDGGDPAMSKLDNFTLDSGTF